ncbi:hypothetical protein [Sphingobacterium sp.]|uniref:hypothetical protein n=1 Tax=Sphingobacterium sp. TaxID=341027 RepID=UPI0031D07F76
MDKFDVICFTILFFILSGNSKAQVENKVLNTVSDSIGTESIFSKRNKKDCVTLPFGYLDISKRKHIDSILSAIQNKNKLQEIKALNFERVIEKDLIFYPEGYDVFLPYIQNINEKYNSIKIASNFLCYGPQSLYFVAIYNTVRYAEPFIERLYLISTKDNKLVDMKRIYFHYEGEMGFAYYTLFNITDNRIISLQDYKFIEGPFKLKPLSKYKILPSGQFSRYYDNDGFYKSEEEQGMVKNHLREGKWIEFKSNNYIDLQQYSSFTDTYTYLEAEYKNGLPVGKWKFYKLLQKYSEETGEPILETRVRGQLIYTEIYKDGILDKREFRHPSKKLEKIINNNMIGHNTQADLDLFTR